MDMKKALIKGETALGEFGAEPLLQSVQAGLGRSLLPCIVADRISGIVRVEVDGGSLLEREIWTLTHPDVRHLARVSAVLAWIEATLSEHEA
jgi:DNA-binding transcriptional LysR family regulator